jgi:hypothetical protein
MHSSGSVNGGKEFVQKKSTLAKTLKAFLYFFQETKPMSPPPQLPFKFWDHGNIELSQCALHSIALLPLVPVRVLFN